MPKLKPGTIFPDDAEDKKIREAVAKDPDTMLLEGANVKLVSLRELKRKRAGRPVADNPKQSVTLRYSPEVIEAFRSTGNGWQTRMDAALKDWLKHHDPDEIIM